MSFKGISDGPRGVSGSSGRRSWSILGRHQGRFRESNEVSRGYLMVLEAFRDFQGVLGGPRTALGDLIGVPVV